MTKVLLFAALVACIAVPFRVFVKGEQTIEVVSNSTYLKNLSITLILFIPI